VNDPAANQLMMNDPDSISYLKWRIQNASSTSVLDHLEWKLNRIIAGHPLEVGTDFNPLYDGRLLYDGEVFILGEPRFVGRMPVRSDQDFKLVATRTA